MGITGLNSFFKVIVLLFSVSIAVSSMAQGDLLSSTIDKATQYRNVGQFQEAVDVLEEFNAKYPGDIWVMRMYAETLFWMKKYEKAAWVYEEAIRLNPDALSVKYKYAMLLFQMGKYEQSRELLIFYTNNKPQDAGAESLLGIVNYYIGYFKEAEEHLEKSLAINPGDKRTKEIYRLVSRIVSPWLKVAVSFTDDSQPMKQWTPILQGGWYNSHFLNLTFLVGLQNFSADTIQLSQFNIQLQNSFRFPKAGFSAKISAGTFYTSADQSFDYTWGLSIHQKMAKHLQLRAGAERSAYTYTLASIVAPFSRNRYNLSLSWEKPKKWNASTGYIGEYFPDVNNIQTFYAWVLSPTITFSVFELNIGYAFNYADSKESRFVPEQSLDEILDDYQPDTKITGVYDPYFTPEDQFANSVLTNFYIIPSQKMIIKLHASVGFYARTMNPYFYLDEKKNGKKVIREGFYQESFTPLDLGIDFDTDLSDKIKLNFSYTYLQTFYFDSNNFHLGLKFYF